MLCHALLLQVGQQGPSSTSDPLQVPSGYAWPPLATAFRICKGGKGRKKTCQTNLQELE